MHSNRDPLHPVDRPCATGAGTPEVAGRRGRSPDLGDLLAHLAEQAEARDAAIDAAGLPRNAYPELAALDDFQQLWSRLRSEAQLRAAQAPAPAGAGPLNSASLAHRALALMHATSPGYLRHFMNYLDTLSWLEQMHADGALATDNAPATAVGSRRARGRSRKRNA